MSLSQDLLSQLPDKISFYKFSASANDFVVIDNRDGSFSNLAGSLAARMCARRYSVGADGLILIENSQQATLRVRFFNPDGNEFSTCGNGGRCAVRFASLFLEHGPAMTLETNVGVIDAKMAGSSVKLKFVEPVEIRMNLPVQVDGREILGDFVRLSEPHFIAYGSNIRDNWFLPLARKIRHHQSFGKQGTNVHFVELKSPQQLKIRSFERGVEDETLACGSGCISAAVATFSAKQTEPPITFEPQSGIPLVVHFQPENHFQDLYLEGDARFIYRGELTKEALSGFPERPR